MAGGFRAIRLARAAAYSPRHGEINLTHLDVLFLDEPPENSGIR